MLPSASKFMKSIIILVGLICVVDNTTQLPQCSMVQEYFDSPKHCIQKTKDSVEFLELENIKHYYLTCKPWHYQELQNSKL